MNLVKRSRDLRFHCFPASASWLCPKAGTKNVLPVASMNGPTHVRAEERRGVSHASAAEERSWASRCLAKDPPQDAPGGAASAPRGPVRPSASALLSTSAVASEPRRGFCRVWAGGAGIAEHADSSISRQPGRGYALSEDSRARGGARRRSPRPPSAVGVATLNMG